MENYQPSAQVNQIIDLNIKTFLIEISKYLKTIYITGLVVLSFFFIKTFTFRFFTHLINPLYKSNKRLYDFIHDFYFNNHTIYIFLLAMITFFVFRYQKSLVKAINSGNQEDLTVSFKNLKVLFRMLAVYIILGFFTYLLSAALNFYELTYH